MNQGTALSPNFPLLKFPSITAHPEELFKAFSSRTLGQGLKSVEMAGTIKLHGAHMDVVIHGDNSMQLQSRRVPSLTLEKDVYGFANFMLPLREQVLALKTQYFSRFSFLNPKDTIELAHPFILSGEWVGPGVQKSVAISKLEKKCFVIISAKVNNRWVKDEDYCDISNESVGIYNIFRKGLSRKLTIDLKTPQSRAKAMEEMQKLANGVQAKCPFAGALGIDGHGEGLVWKATASPDLRRGAPPLHENPRHWFKVLGSKLKESHTDQLAMPSGDEDMKEHARKFAESCVTKTRLNKKLADVKEIIWLEEGRDPDNRDVSIFINLVNQDVMAEESMGLSGRGLNVGKNKRFLDEAIEVIAEHWFLEWTRL